MIVLCPVSLGELVDKVTILQLKSENIPDPDKSEKVRAEYEGLLRVLNECVLPKLELSNLREALYKINSELWIIEDQIREHERDGDFGPEFVSLARAVYRTNDRRFEVKKSINEKFGSNYQEVKSYSKY